MEVPGLGVKSELSCQPAPQPQQCRIPAMSTTYTAAHSNAVLNPLSRARGQTHPQRDNIRSLTWQSTELQEELVLIVFKEEGGFIRY